MAMNEIIFIDDSSDDEILPCKRIKLDTDTKPHSLQELKITDIKSLNECNDEIVILDDTEPNINNNNIPNNLLNNGGHNQSILNNYENNDEVLIIEDNDKFEIDNKEQCDKVKKECVENEKTVVDSENYDNKSNALNGISSPSCSKSSEEFNAFIQACCDCKCSTLYKDVILKKLPKLKHKYNEADEHLVNSTNFKVYLTSNTDNIKKRPSNAIITFNNVYRELESKKKQVVELSERNQRHLRKLAKALKEVYKKIMKLETEEVNFDDDNNSSYIKLNRYKDRCCLIYKKMCHIMNKNFYCGRFMYHTLNYDLSKYSEINKAIVKLYAKKKNFLTYYDVDQCIRKCVIDHNINLSEDMLKTEIKCTFTSVGKILQRRRKVELYESLNYFIEEAEEDPADKNPELKNLLKERHMEFEKRLDQVFQKYVDFEEKGDNPKISSDSDDSHYKSEAEETTT